MTGGVEVREKTLRGLPTAWLQAGPSGPAADQTPILLLFHGFPDGPECWDLQIAAFKDRYSIVAPFGRGAAPSAKGKRLGRYGPDAVALDVLAILDEVDPTRQRRVAIVGHDLGAVHAWHVASLLRGRVAGLIVLNGLTIRQMLARWRQPRQLAKSWYIFLMQLPLLPELLASAAPGPILDLAHAQGGLPRPLRPAAAVVRSALAGPLNQYRAFLREAPRLATRPRRRLGCPVLVLWGADDAFVLPPRLDELSADADELTVRILAGNHWLHRTQPETVNALIADFLGRHGAGA